MTIEYAKKEYEELKKSGDTDAENFDDYLENITEKNGTFKQVKR